jgi:carbonic anhydrase
VERGKLALHGAYFGIAAGRLLVRDPETGSFEPVADTAQPVSPLPRSGRGSG